MPKKLWKKGHPKWGGRKKGTPNSGTVEIRELAARLLDDPAYQKTLQQRLQDGTVPPVVETMLYYYRYGKPKEEVRHSGDVGLLATRIDPAQLQHMTTEELEDARRLFRKMLGQGDDGDEEG